jgi:hypothetical protein
MGGVGSGGQNRKSIAEHVRRGTYRPDRHGRVVSLPPPAGPPPAPPEGLSATSTALWAAVTDEFDGWASHELALLRLALLAADRAAECCATIGREGLVLVGKRGGARRPHPLLRVQRAEEAFVVDVFRQLRLGR